MRAFVLDEVEQDLRTTAAQLAVGPLGGRSAEAAATRSDADGLWEHLGAWTELRDHSCAAMCLFLEQIARSSRPQAFFASSGLAAPFVREAVVELYKDMTRGSVKASLALDHEGTLDAAPDPTTVIDLDLVDVVVRVRRAGEAGVVEVFPRAELAAARGQSLDLARTPWQVDLRGVLPSHTGELTPAQLRRTSAESMLAVCADVVGAVEAVLELSTMYARTREQFGRPIGAFQAVQHRLVAIVMALERARAATHAAAMAIDDHRGRDEESRAVHVAKLAVNRAAQCAADNGVQVHGGIGFTWENPLHLHVRRAMAGRGLWGGSAWHLRALADLEDGQRRTT